MIIGELRKLQATASMIDSRFAAAEKAAVELRRRRIKEEEARVFAEKEQRQRAELRRKVAHEADLAKEEIGKQATTDAKTMDQKKLHKLIKSSAAESFSQMLHNENSRRVFDAYLAHHAGTSDDLHFYLEALEFRGQLYISKEQERKVALRCASYGPQTVILHLNSVALHQATLELAKIANVCSNLWEIARLS